MEESKLIGYVYLLQSGSQYKIGFSKNHPRKRVRQLRTGSPFPVFVIHWIKTEFYRRVEKQLHHRFHEKRGEGEWFALSDEDVAHIRSLNEFGRTAEEQETADAQYDAQIAKLQLEKRAKIKAELQQAIGVVAAV